MHSHDDSVGFVPPSDIAPDLASGFVDAPSRPSVRGEPLPLNIYTVGDTSGEPEPEYKTELANVPLHVTARFVPLEAGENSHMPAPSPLFQVPHAKSLDATRMYPQPEPPSRTVKEVLAPKHKLRETKELKRRAIESEMAPEAARLLKALGHEVPSSPRVAITSKPITMPLFSDSAAPIVTAQNPVRDTSISAATPPIITKGIPIVQRELEPEREKKNNLRAQK